MHRTPSTRHSHAALRSLARLVRNYAESGINLSRSRACRMQRQHLREQPRRSNRRQSVSCTRPRILCRAGTEMVFMRRPGALESLWWDISYKVKASRSQSQRMQRRRPESARAWLPPRNSKTTVGRALVASWEAVSQGLHQIYAFIRRCAQTLCYRHFMMVVAKP